MRRCGNFAPIAYRIRYRSCVAPPAQWERFDVERNGVTIEAWLLKPADFDPNNKYPLVLDVHGGPHTQYGETFFDEAQVQSAAGFVVIHPHLTACCSARLRTAWIRAMLPGDSFAWRASAP